MRLKLALIGSILLLLSLAAGCAQQSVVVLIPDPNGKVGKVTISNPAGEQTLDEPGEATKVSGAEAKPEAPVIMDQAEIQRRFGEALAARPSPPVYFILYFRTESTRPAPASRDLIPKILAAVKQRESVDVSVVGHCDTAGSDQYNVRLSRRRAEAVARMLIKGGVDPKTLEITSHGSRRLLIPTGDNVHEPRNRRVEVTVR